MSDQEQTRDPITVALDEVFGQAGEEVPPTAWEQACEAEVLHQEYRPWDFRRYCDMEDMGAPAWGESSSRDQIREAFRSIERMVEFQQRLAEGVVVRRYARIFGAIPLFGDASETS